MPALGLASTPSIAGGQRFQPEDYGARGDGKSNDTAAFEKMAKALNDAGGGTIVLQRRTYIVGAQRRNVTGKGYAYVPSAILEITGCSSPVSIVGNGATLRCAPDLRYGSFDAKTEMPLTRPLPFYGDGVLATPYLGMIVVSKCRGSVSISGLTLDGVADQLALGGLWGDTGRQIAGSGIVLSENSGDELVDDVTVRNHPLDGILINGINNASHSSRRLTRVVADRNGRQGCSLVGGYGYSFEECKFVNTGRGRIASAPAAGFDIEAEEKLIRNIRFKNCLFSDNVGCGLLVDSGDSANISFETCKFVGTTSWSAWPKKPNIRFSECAFIGALSNCYGVSETAATRFVGCTFLDDPALAPGNKIFLGGGANGPIADLSTERFMRFEYCRFQLTHSGRLPWSTGAVYSNTTMVQRDKGLAYPRGVYLGRSSIVGNVDLSSSKVRGDLIVNGRKMPRSG